MLDTSILIIITLVLAFVLCIIYLRWSTTKVFSSDVRLDGKVVIVTGANSGIGYYTARNLAKRGARVILACRNATRGETARTDILKECPGATVEFRQLDLSSLESVRTFASNVIESETELHVLVNNAGVYNLPDYTHDGIIETVQVNYFGHFLLTLLLLPLLKKSGASRIINLSSILHFLGGFNEEDINKKRCWKNFADYCNSKLCMLLFTKELSRRLEGTGVVANAVHPGVILTNITSDAASFPKFMFWLWCRMYGRTAEHGASTVEYLAAAEECSTISGGYYVDCAKRIVSWKVNKNNAEKLWTYSEKLVRYSP